MDEIIFEKSNKRILSVILLFLFGVLASLVFVMIALEKDFMYESNTIFRRPADILENRTIFIVFTLFAICILALLIIQIFLCCKLLFTSSKMFVLINGKLFYINLGLFNIQNRQLFLKEIKHIKIVQSENSKKIHHVMIEKYDGNKETIKLFFLECEGLELKRALDKYLNENQITLKNN